MVTAEVGEGVKDPYCFEVSTTPSLVSRCSVCWRNDCAVKISIKQDG